MADNAKAYIGISNQGLEQVNGKILIISEFGEGYDTLPKKPK
jgi:hypothetical protein